MSKENFPVSHEENTHSTTYSATGISKRTLLTLGMGLLGVMSATVYILNSYAENTVTAHSATNTDLATTDSSSSLQAYSTLSALSTQLQQTIGIVFTVAAARVLPHYMGEAARVLPHIDDVANVLPRYMDEDDFWQLPTAYGTNYTDTQNPNTYAVDTHFTAAAPDGTRITCMTNYQNPNTHITTTNIAFTITAPNGRVIAMDQFVNLGNVASQSSCSIIYVPPGTVLPDGSTVVPASGGFLLTYQAQLSGQYGPYTNIYFSAVSITGQPLVSSPVLINTDANISVTQGIPVLRPNNNTAVIGTSYQTGTGYSAIMLFTQAQQSPLQLSAGLTGNQNNPAAIGSQTILTSWTNQDTVPTQIVFTTITYDSHNQPVLGSLITPQPTNTTHQDFSAVAFGPDQERVITWQNDDGTVSLYAYTADGNLLFSLDDVGIPGLQKPRIAISDEGIITLVGHSETYAPSVTDWDIVSVSFTLTGQKLPGQPFVVNSDEKLGEQSYPNIVSLKLAPNLAIYAVSYRTASVGGEVLPNFTETTRYFALGPNIVADNSLVNLLEIGKTLFIFPTPDLSNPNITTTVQAEVIPCNAGSISFPTNTTNVISLSICESHITGDAAAVLHTLQQLSLNITATEGPVTFNVTVSTDSGQPAYGLQLELLPPVIPTPPTAAPSTPSSTGSPPPASESANTLTPYISVFTTLAGILSTIILTNLGNRLRQGSKLIKARADAFDKVFLDQALAKNPDFLGRRNFSFFGGNAVVKIADFKNEFDKRGFNYDKQIRALIPALVVDVLYKKMQEKNLEFVCHNITKDFVESVVVQVIADYHQTLSRQSTIQSKKDLPPPPEDPPSYESSSASSSSTANLMVNPYLTATQMNHAGEIELAEINSTTPTPAPTPGWFNRNAWREWLRWS